MDFSQIIASKLNLPVQKVSQTINLIKDSNTIPFIARYRKEMTGGLDEVQIREIGEALSRLENLDQRRHSILQSLDEQGSLSSALRKAIENAATLTQLEDLYQPYRPKRRTRATDAREKGLAPLADQLIRQLVSTKSLDALLAPFLNEKVLTAEAALNGAADIAAEIIAENAHVRQSVRKSGFEHSTLVSEIIKNSQDERQTYALYYQFEQRVKDLRPHQILAINRGESDKVLRISILFREADWQTAIFSQFPLDQESVFYETLKLAAEDSAQRLLLPAIVRDIRRGLTEKAETHAIGVFSLNLKGLLTQPPLTNQVVLAIDPGFRTGSKVVILDPTGRLLDTGTIYPHPPQNRQAEAYQTVNDLIKKYQVTLIVIGNGTASRETEQFVAEITKQDDSLNYIITSEAGASVYSASEIARQEFPDLDVSIRGAVSIGRRVQDPLAELVKIDPKSIGVGLYQHDLNQTKLSEALSKVVESVVNAVGVDVNTASVPLLSYVSGIGPALAEKMVQYREGNGPFSDRESFHDVPGLGTKTFEQCAAFLRIRDGSNPLDATAIHPESYPIARRLFTMMSLPMDADQKSRSDAVKQFKAEVDFSELMASLDAGSPTILDILDEIARPGRDPREKIPKPILRKDVLNMEDLTPGMQLMGTIRNVVDFGAFVDIGVKTDGLLHKSKIKKDMDLQVGEIINVQILSIDHERNRISLDLKESTQS